MGNKNQFIYLIAIPCVHKIRTQIFNGLGFEKAGTGINLAFWFPLGICFLQLHYQHFCKSRRHSLRIRIQISMELQNDVGT